MSRSLWYRDAVFYEVYLRAFADGNADGHGDLHGLMLKLDYLQDLGVDCLWLLPIFPSPLLDDGYDVADFCGVHPDYGTLDDFRLLLAEAHTRNLRVIIDMVLNHTSSQHPWFQAARADRTSPYADYYVWSDTNQGFGDARVIFVDSENSNWAWDTLAGKYYWHRFYAFQPDLNYASPAVRAEMSRVVDFWLELGVDGFRVDAAPYLFERDGTNCENLPETHDYLKHLRRRIDRRGLDRILLAEANQWPVDLRPYFGDGDEFHMAFHFPLMPRIFAALARANREPVVRILEDTPPIPETCQWCTFLRNHDELTLEMVTEDEREFLWQAYAPQPRMRLNLGIRRRLAPLLDGDRRKIELAHSLLLTLPGSPILYYGDEIGMGDDIWLDDRAGLRTPMQWDDRLGAGFSAASHLYASPIESEPYSYRRVNVASQQADPGSLWHALRRMIHNRKSLPGLSRGGCEILDLPDRSILAVARSLHEGELVLAVHNLSASNRSLSADLRRWTGARIEDLLSGRALPGVTEEPYELALRPYQYRWLRLALPWAAS